MRADVVAKSCMVSIMVSRACEHNFVKIRFLLDIFHVLQNALRTRSTLYMYPTTVGTCRVRTLAGSHAPMLASGSHVRFLTYFGTRTARERASAC